VPKHLRPIHTTRTYGPYVLAVFTARKNGQYVRVYFLTPVRTARTYGPYVLLVRTGRTYCSYVRPVRTGSAYPPLGNSPSLVQLS